MLKNYLKIALRNIKKNHVFSLINVFGLAIGLAGCLIIYQYVSFEASYNSFHDNSEDIYRISYSKEKDGVESFNTVLTYSGVGPLLKENFPEVTEFARLRPNSVITASSIVTYEDQVFEEDRVYFADPSFLEMFSFELVQGDPKSALNEPFSMVITQATARKYFGSEDPIGRVMRHGNNRNFTVTGILEDVPMNSHVKFDFLLAHSTLNAIMPESWSEENLTTFHGHLYVVLEEGTDIENFKSKLPQFVDDHVGGLQLKENGTLLKFGVMSIEDIHLHSNIDHEAEVNGDYRTIQYLSIIALLILFIAWVNYINLSTARAIERANEVGVRKVLGAQRRQLIGQFLFEAGIINIVAIALAIGMVALAQPLFIRFGAEQMLQTNIWSSGNMWMAIALLLLIGILFSGLYPALALSGFKPVDVMKGGNYRSHGGALLRKTLVVFQFAASVALIIGTSVVYLQINFLRNQDLGVDIDRALVVNAPRIADSTYIGKWQGFKSDLSNHSLIKSVISTSDIPGREFNSSTWYKKIGDTDENAQFCYRSVVDEDFVPSLGIEMAAGRNFTSEDNNFNIILNEAAVDLFDFTSAEEAVGAELTFLGANEDFRLRVIGVTNNYHHMSPKLAYSPLLINFSPGARRYYIIKFNTGDQPRQNIQETISLTERAYQASFEGNPFNYFFLDETFEEQYRGDKQFGDLFGFFALLAVLVACLGLFGLSSYTVLRRTKEIGIKKVLGSSVPQLLRTLSKDYVNLILIANAVSWPVIYFLMNGWLKGFARHIPVYWWLFPLAALVITLLALLTVSYHTWRAAKANPIEALRYE